MHCTPSPSTPRRLSKRAGALWLAVIALSLLDTGCTTAAPAGKTRFACYDVRGRLVESITHKGECEARDWEWRQHP